MSRTLDGLLADALIESISATTPHTRHSRSRARPRRSTAVRNALGWAAVAFACLITLAMASGNGA